MRSENNILIAFILNLVFSIFELIGGIFTNSISIISDSIHDIGDSISIGISYLLEKISKRKPDDKYTYGYARYSVIGSLITIIILIIGSIVVVYNSIYRIINPVEINYNGMIIFAIIGVVVNFFAAYFTRDGESLNQRSVNLHMLEDVLGWIIVLFGAVIMKFTNIRIIDSILSIFVAIFILKHAINNFKVIIDLFLEKTPKDISIDEIKSHLLEIKGVIDVHHIHIWSIDGYSNYATMHIVYVGKNKNIKSIIKDELKEHNICHSTIEFEKEDELCSEKNCSIDVKNTRNHHHHH